MQRRVRRRRCKARHQGGSTIFYNPLAVCRCILLQQFLPFSSKLKRGGCSQDLARQEERREDWHSPKLSMKGILVSKLYILARRVWFASAGALFQKREFGMDFLFVARE